MGRTTAVALGFFVAAARALRADDSECHGIKTEDTCNFKSKEDCMWDTVYDVCLSLDIKITELMIEFDNRGDGSRFVEILNRGDSILILGDVVLDGIFTGVIRNHTLLETEQYLVLYDGAKDIPQCLDCDCSHTHEGTCANAVYVKCCDDCDCQSVGRSVNNRKWNQVLTVESNGIELDNLSFDPRNFPAADKGYGTYLKKPTTADNQNGHNWMQTCNTQGTAGAKPFGLNDCTWFCTDDECEENGAMDAMCVHNDAGDYCDCTADDGYYYEEEIHTCWPIPMADECEAVWTSDDTGVKHLHYSWVPPIIERDVNYSLEYHSTTGRKRVLTMTTSQDIYDHADETAAVLGYVRTIIGEHISEAEECVGGVSPTADEGTTTKESDSSSSNNNSVPAWAWILIAFLLLTALVGGILAYKFWWLKRVQTPWGGLYTPFTDKELL